MALSIYEDGTFGPEEVQLKCRFQVDSSGDVDFIVGGGRAVEDIIHVSAGVYDILMAQGCAFEDLINCHVSPATLLDVGNFTSWTFSTRKLRITLVLNDGSPAVADPADNSWVHVSATWCRRSTMANVRAI